MTRIIIAALIAVSLAACGNDVAPVTEAQPASPSKNTAAYVLGVIYYDAPGCEGTPMTPCAPFGQGSGAAAQGTVRSLSSTDGQCLDVVEKTIGYCPRAL